MNTPPPLPKPPQAKFSWKHYLGMILVCLFVSTCTNVMDEVTDEFLEKAKIKAYYLKIQNQYRQVDLQKRMIDLRWEVIEEMADAETASQ